MGKGYEANLDKLFRERLLDELVLGNTIPIKKYAKDHPKVKVLPFEPLFASAIERIHEDRSMSMVLKYDGAMEIYDRSRYLFKGDPKYVKIGHIKLPTLDS